MFPPQGRERRADEVTWDYAHGRADLRELWVVDSCEMTDYLQDEWEWPGMQLSGRIRRFRKRRYASTWESQKTWTWVSSLSPKVGSAKRVAHDLRAHWAIENGTFRVRDVTFDEDRLHGRKIGHALSILRNIAITIIRREDYPYIPDGCRDIAAHRDHGFSLLTKH